MQNVEFRMIEETDQPVNDKVISFEQEPPPSLRFPSKALGIVLAIFGLLAALLIFFGLLPLIKIQNDVRAFLTESKEISQALEKQDLTLVLEKISSSQKQLDQLEQSYKKLGWIKFVPVLGNFYADGGHLIASGRYLFEAGQISGEAIKPYADLLGLEDKEREKSPPPMTVEQRLELALNTLDKLQPHLDAIGEKLELARKEVDQVNAARYPEAIFGRKIREKVVSLANAIRGVTEAIIEVKPIAGHLKTLVGIPQEKRYLLLFQNDTELRPTGGFLTAYAIISVNNGNFKPLGSFDIYTLDGRFGNRLPAPRPIKEFHKNVFAWHLRDMNLSPDFKVFMETFMENYGKVEDKAKIDGVVAVDTQILVDVLKVLGPIGVGGWGNFSAEKDARCDCPQVVYQLESLADRPVGAFRTERKAVLGPLMHSLLLNIMQSPRKKWPEFFNLLFKNIKEKHILFYFPNEDIQKAMETLNASGRIKEFEGDYLLVVDANFAGAKSNMFIKESFTQEIAVGSDGTVTKQLTIDYKNPAPPSNCNLEAGQLCLNGLYRDWVRIFVPLGSKLLESSGSEISVNTYEELGKTVFEAFYGDKSPLRPMGKTQLTFKYQLPFKYDSHQPYKILIQKQPGTYGYENTIVFDGAESTFNLLSDQELGL